MADVLAGIASIQRHNRAMRRNSVRPWQGTSRAECTQAHAEKASGTDRTKSKWVRKFRAQRDTWRIERAERAALEEAEAEPPARLQEFEVTARVPTSPATGEQTEGDAILLAARLGTAIVL